MTTRTDVVVDFSATPRVAEVAAPSTEFNAQDVVDTLRKKEDSTRGIAETKLLNASGKESLGGGVFVGVTAELQDTKIAFEARTTPAQTGTVTSASSTPINNTIQLADAAATFQAKGVQRGSLIINYTDKAITEVVSVQSESLLTCKIPVNGASNTFTVGDSYDIFNIVQCSILGGNVVAVDSTSAEIPAVLPTAFTQVVKVSASSATLQEQKTIQYSSFQNKVWIDTVNGNPKSFNTLSGNREFPVNTVSDALLVASERGLSGIGMLSSLNLGAGDVVDNLQLFGINALLTVLVLNSGVSTIKTQITDVTLLGVLSGGTIVERSVIGTLTYISGYVHLCALGSGTITLAGGPTSTAYFFDCYVAVPGTPNTLIDFNNSGGNLVMQGLMGDVTLKNKSGAGAVTITMKGGEVVLESTVTGGTLLIQGTGTLRDTSGNIIQSGNFGGATIVNRTSGMTPDLGLLLQQVSVDTAFIREIEGGRWKIDTVTNQMIFFKNDNITEVARFDLKDATGLPSTSSIFERSRV